MKRLPAIGLINDDMSEGACQIYDNAFMNKIIGMFKLYHNQRVMMSPKDYYQKMSENKIGGLDLDGIRPYTGENPDGTVKQPTDEESAFIHDQMGW